MIAKGLLIFSLLLLINFKTWAGQEANGGVGVFCTNAAGVMTSFELYDHFEARVAYQMLMEMGDYELSYTDKVDAVLDRLARVNPTRAGLYRQWFGEFSQEAEFLPGIKLIDTPDVGSGYIPKNCKLEQIAVQRDPVFPQQKRYTISYDLWKLMDENAKAGLILHELILRELAHQSSYPHKTSTMARYLNGFISSSDMESISLRRYLKALQLLKVEFGDTHLGTPIVVYNGRLSPPSNFEFYDDNIVRSGDAVLRNDRGESETSHIQYFWRGQSLKLVRQAYSFFPNGRLAYLNIVADDNPILIQVGPNQIARESGLLTVELYPSDELKAVYYTGFEKFVHPNYLGSCSEPQFFPGEIIERCGFSKPVQVKIENQWIRIKPCIKAADGIVHFDSDGTAHLKDASGHQTACVE